MPERTMTSLILPPVSLHVCLGPRIMRLYVVGVLLMLRQQGLDVKFYDQTEDPEAFVGYLSSGAGSGRSKARTYCVAMFLSNKKNALSLLRDIRECEPSAQVIVFGPFASVFYRRIIEEKLADIVVRMDPDFVLPLLLSGELDTKQMSGIPNLAYSGPDGVVVTATKLFDELDQLPFVSPYLHDQGYSTVDIATARGCSYRCSFCDRHCLWGGRVRVRSVAHVISEVEQLALRKEVREFCFCDSTFVINKQRTVQLCKALGALPRMPKWACATRVDTVDQNLLRVMHWAGCETIHFGVESCSPTVLRKLGKRYRQQDIINAVRWSQNAGLKVGVFMTVGNPGETIRSLRQTKNFLTDFGPTVELLINPLVILPGTRIYYELLEQKKIVEEDYFDSDEPAYYNFDADWYKKEFSAFRKHFEGFPSKNGGSD